MKCKNIIPNKVKYYNDFINSHNIADQLIASNKRSKYDIEIYLNVYFLFQKLGVSYDNFYELFEYAAKIGPNNYPKRTALHTFKEKLSKLNLHKSIHNENITTHNLITNDCLIDSVIIPNKCNIHLSGTYNYKGKKATKITHITNDIGYPLLTSVDAANINDAKLGANIITNNIDILKIHKINLLADKGYDSSIIRTTLTDNGCTSIIPKNIRKADNNAVKDIKCKEREKINMKRKQLMNEQKVLNKQKIKNENLKKRLKNNKNININNLTLKELTDQIKEILAGISKIKNKRKQLPIKLKENIKKEIAELDTVECDEKLGFRKCPFCAHLTVCNKCEKCKKCKKHLSYYKGLTNDEIITYKKRIRVEHFISHFKNGRTATIRDKKTLLLKDTVYNRYTDFLFIKKLIQYPIKNNKCKKDNIIIK